MSKLEKYLAKVKEDVVRKEIEVKIDGDVWKVRELTLTEQRTCERLAEKNDKFDGFMYNDARIVKATEHDFPWSNKELQEAYGAADKYELPAKLFNNNVDGYTKLLNAVRNASIVSTENETVEDLKN